MTEGKVLRSNDRGLGQQDVSAGTSKNLDTRGKERAVESRALQGRIKKGAYSGAELRDTFDNFRRSISEKKTLVLRINLPWEDKLSASATCTSHAKGG